MPPAALRLATPDRQALLARLAIVRWFVLAAAAALTLAAGPVLGIALPGAPMLAVIVVSALLNAFAIHRLRSGREEGDAALVTQVAIDIVTLSSLLFFSGGATNPLVSLLLPPVAIAALLLPVRTATGLAALAVAAYSLLMVAYLPLAINDPARATRLHLLGMWATFAVSAALVTWLVANLSHALRRRDAELAAAREQAVRDEAILAMGTLAAGTAHELGTPLATMALLAGELARDPGIPATAAADVALLREQIGACKEIIDRLSRRADASDLEAASSGAADLWLAALCERWLALRPLPGSRLTVLTPGPAPRLTADPRLEQAVLNLLDNAANASRQPVDIELEWSERGIAITISDCGPGFPPEVLAVDGRAALPAHPGGSGIGLLLTRSAVEQLGGTLLLANPTGGGARARLELPSQPQ